MQRKGTEKFRKLAVLNRKIVRLSSELETLQYMQDLLEREMTPLTSRSQEVSSSPRRSRRHDQRERRASAKAEV
jgi:hypothetical protein